MYLKFIFFLTEAFNDTTSTPQEHMYIVLSLILQNVLDNLESKNRLIFSSDVQ